MADTHPSTARLDKRGDYIPCPKNQPFAYQSTQAHDNGQLNHITSVQGYCKQHQKLGCEVCTE